MGFFQDLFGGSEQQSQSTSQQQVASFQQPFLQQQFGAAQQLAQQQAGPIGQQAFPLAEQLSGQGQQLLSGLGQGAGQQLNQFISPDSGFADQQIGALGQLLQRNLSQSLGQVSQQAVGSGGFGGSRQGLAQGTAIGDTQLAFGAGAADILQGDVQRRQAAATSQAGLQAGSALGGLESLQGLFNLGLSGFGAQFAPLQAAAGIIGGPIIEGQSQSTGSGTSSGGVIPGLSGLFSVT